MLLIRRARSIRVSVDISYSIILGRTLGRYFGTRRVAVASTQLVLPSYQALLPYSHRTLLSFDVTRFPCEASKRCLETLGVVVLRVLLSDAALDALTAKTKRILTRPALGGSIGYYQKDPNKKLFDCFLLGSEA